MSSEQTSLSKFLDLVRFIPRAPDCFVYLVVDAKRTLIAAARLGLQRAVEG